MARLPWLKQWHNDLDPTYNTQMGDYFEGFIQDEARQMGKTPEQIRPWEPPQRTNRIQIGIEPRCARNGATLRNLPFRMPLYPGRGSG